MGNIIEEEIKEDIFEPETLIQIPKYKSIKESLNPEEHQRTNN